MNCLSMMNQTSCNSAYIATPAGLSDLNVLSEEELAAISGAGWWNWGGAIYHGARNAVFGGVAGAVGASYAGLPIGTSGIAGMITGGVQGALQGGLPR
jgi:lactobin A/cerein 7B family class IIb bacteriocin